MPETYKIRRITGIRKNGVTVPSLCTLEAALKFDSTESPHCVYNEYVAHRLAQTLHAPVAEGVLTNTGDGQAYASLMLHSPGINLPDVLELLGNSNIGWKLPILPLRQRDHQDRDTEENPRACSCAVSRVSITEDPASRLGELLRFCCSPVT